MWHVSKDIPTRTWHGVQIGVFSIFFTGTRNACTGVLSEHIPTIVHIPALRPVVVNGNRVVIPPANPPVGMPFTSSIPLNAPKYYGVD